jgi:hypothetical protein
MLHEQKEGQYNNIKVNKSLQSVAEFRYSIDEEINNNEYRECLLTFSPDFFVFLFAA